ncbi:hypothetical protein [Streptomyces buecherae]|uniref:hypothetical protein n=1 Tax=Streptomyces buecherae TaxID=2763006 RepID=UPI001C2540AD|nr:hypothetical protein [Streptomyces buecherae]
MTRGHHSNKLRRSGEEAEDHHWSQHSGDEEEEGERDEEDIEHQGSRSPHGIGHVIRKVLPWLIALAFVALVAYAVLWFIDFNNDLEHPEGNFDDWQCHPDYGPCGLSE